MKRTFNNLGELGEIKAFRKLPCWSCEYIDYSFEKDPCKKCFDGNQYQKFQRRTVHCD